jgi:hypothetical protein
MNDPVFQSIFTAYLGSVSLTTGRVVFFLRDSPNDVAQAVTLAYVKDKLLSVTAYQGVGDDPICSFVAIIPAIQRALEFKGKTGQVHFEIDETGHREMVRLIGNEDRAIRLEIGIEGDRKSKEKPSKGDYGYFWQYLYRHGFQNRPDMLEVFDDLRASNHRPNEYQSELLIRECFGVQSRAQISPAMLRDWLRVRRLPDESGVYVLIAQAERETSRRKAA